MADEAEAAIAPQRAVQQVRLGEGLKAVADAEHQPSVVGEGRHLLHDGAEAGDGAGAQVVAVGEAAGQDDAIGVLEIVVLVPEVVRFGLGKVRESVVRVVVAVGAGEDDDAEADRSLRPPSAPLLGRPSPGCISNR